MYNFFHIIRLYRCVAYGAVALDLAAFSAFVIKDIFPFWIRHSKDGVHNTAAWILTVARHIVHMQRTQAERAVIAGRYTKRKYLFAAVLTNKSTVIFCKALGFHKNSYMNRKYLGNTEIDSKKEDAKVKSYNMIKYTVLCVVLSVFCATVFAVSAAGNMNENGVVSDGGISFGDARDGIVSDVSEGMNNIRNGIDKGINDLSGNSRSGANRSGDVSDDGLAGMDDTNNSGADASGTNESRPDTSGTMDSTSGSTNNANGADGADTDKGGVTTGIIIAVLVVIAVVIVIFLLVPKKRS